jgi:LacI family transcriptional regulator
MMADGKSDARVVNVRPRRVVARCSTNPEAFEDADVAAAVRFIRANACEEGDVSSICRIISVSRRQLERKFHEVLGHSPGEEISRVRMDRARELLATTSLSVSNIAVRCGYGHMSSFSTAFRKLFGVTPRAYRIKYAAQGSGGEEKGSPEPAHASRNRGE